MASSDPRPPVWVGHVHMSTPDLAGSYDFMLLLGLRPIGRFETVAVLELRGGTHLVLTSGEVTPGGDAPFDLMVEDLDAFHARLTEAGVEASAIERGKIHDRFHVTDPSGQRVRFNSSHVSDRPV